MKVENVKVYDLEESVKASKYPMSADNEKLTSDITKTTIKLGSCSKGTGHDQFLTGIRVAFDLTCSNKMWVEAERYRFLEFVSSQSTMHRIIKFDIEEQCNEFVDKNIIKILNDKIEKYSYYLNNKEETIRTYDLVDKYEEYIKQKYLEILYNVPSGFELTARLTTNYRALKTIYSQRKNHRLPEWREFCKWIEKLPYFKELCFAEVTNTSNTQLEGQMKLDV